MSEYQGAALIIVAAGSGQRMGGGVPKALRHLCAEPLLTHAVRSGLGGSAVTALVVVAPQENLSEVHALVQACADNIWWRIVPGGRTRTESVAAGLEALAERREQLVLVHDAARALAPAQLFDDVVTALRAGAEAVVPALSVVDTIKQVDSSEHVVGTVDRTPLRAIQTPQGFNRTLLERAHLDTIDATDDAGLVEKLGVAVLCIPGSERARKITTPFDLLLAETVLKTS